MLSPASHAKHLRMNTPASFTGERELPGSKDPHPGRRRLRLGDAGQGRTAVSEARSLSRRRAPLPRGWPGGGRSASARWTPARHPCCSLPFRPRLRPCCPALSLTGRSAAARRPPAEPSRGPTGFTRRPGSPRCAHTETAERGECGAGPRDRKWTCGRMASERPALRAHLAAALTWLPSDARAEPANIATHSTSWYYFYRGHGTLAGAKGSHELRASAATRWEDMPKRG